MNTFNDAPWPMAAEQNEIVSFSFLDNTVDPNYPTFDASASDQVTWETAYSYDQAHAMQSQLFQFGNDDNDHGFNFVPEPPLQAQWSNPAVGDAYGHGAHCGSAYAPSTSSNSTSWGLVDEGHPTPSVSSDPFASSSSSSFDPVFSWDSSMSFIDFGSQETSRFSGSESSIPHSENGRSDERGAEAQQSTTAMDRNTEASWGERAVSDPDIVHYQQEPWHSGSAQAGWTYRQVLEIVAFPPPDAPHLWHQRIAQLAANLGMPSGATGKEIIMFVMQVAAMKNDLDRVAPLVKAIGMAASVLEGRFVVPHELKSIFADFYPSAARVYGVKTTREAVELNTLHAGHCAEISLALGQPSVSPRIDVEEAATGSEAEDGLAPERPIRSRVTEGDRYCRVGACLEFFKDAQACMKHRTRHFPLAWQCPGPCRTRSKTRGKFVRGETLKRHFTSPRFAGCKDAVLRLLKLDSIPSSGRGGMGWMARLRNGPERQWERPGFHLTDLETVKARLRDPNVAASRSAVPSISSRRR